MNVRKTKGERKISKEDAEKKTSATFDVEINAMLKSMMKSMAQERDSKTKVMVQIRKKGDVEDKPENN